MPFAILNQSNNYNVNIPMAIQWLIKDQKGTKGLREIFLKSTTTIPIGQVKWTRELSLPNREDWETLYLRATKCNLNARIKYFNYKILQHTLITNKNLHQFGIAPSEMCEHCGAIETISHLLLECPNIQTIWDQIELWINTN